MQGKHKKRVWRFNKFVRSSEVERGSKEYSLGRSCDGVKVAGVWRQACVLQRGLWVSCAEEPVWVSSLFCPPPLCWDSLMTCLFDDVKNAKNRRPKDAYAMASQVPSLFLSALFFFFFGIFFCFCFFAVFFLWKYKGRVADRTASTKHVCTEKSGRRWPSRPSGRMACEYVKYFIWNDDGPWNVFPQHNRFLTASNNIVFNCECVPYCKCCRWVMLSIITAEGMGDFFCNVYNIWRSLFV